MQLSFLSSTGGFSLHHMSHSWTCLVDIFAERPAVAASSGQIYLLCFAVFRPQARALGSITSNPSRSSRAKSRIHTCRPGAFTSNAILLAQKQFFVCISLATDGHQRARLPAPTYCNVAILPVVTLKTFPSLLGSAPPPFFLFIIPGRTPSFCLHLTLVILLSPNATPNQNSQF